MYFCKVIEIALLGPTQPLQLRLALKGESNLDSVRNGDRGVKRLAQKLKS